MLFNEAHWIGDILTKYPVEQLSPLINLGSSTKDFREKGQPFIFDMLIEPLEQRGVKVIHVDLDDGEGVDIAGDIFDPDVFGEIQSHNPGSVICANILEHVVDPGQLAKACVDMVRDNGLIFASVPYSFPFHLAPIDTMFRPTIEELANLFPDCSLLESEVVNCGSFGQQIIRSPKVLFKHMVRMAVPWPTGQHWKAAIHRNMWLFKEYRTSCVVLEKK